MAPSPDSDVGDRQNSSVVTAEEFGAGKGQSGSNPVIKSVPADREIPVQGFEDAKLVPDDFVIKDLTKIPTRMWGNADDSSEAALKESFPPLIDMLPLMNYHQDQQPEDEEGAKKVIAQIGKACEEWGFFQVVNHGMAETLLDSLVEAALEFFDLPLEEKQAYFTSSARIERDRHWSDTICHDVQPKPAPEDDSIPDKPSRYRPLIEEYTKGVQNLLHVLCTTLSEYLGLESSAIEKAQDEFSKLGFRVNYYPKCPEPEKVVGLFPHKDFGWMTVVLQNEVGGLQVQKPGTDLWADVSPKKGSLLINIANQVEILSNGRFNSSMHRALVNKFKPRLSIAGFATPGPDCIIKPLPELLEKTKQLPRYKQLVYRDYVPNVIVDVQAGVSPDLRYEINRN